MQKLFIIVCGLVVGVFLASAGTLIAVSGKGFLRFYDFCFRGDYVGRTASWRENVDKAEWKAIGVLALAFGAYIIWTILRNL